MSRNLTGNKRLLHDCCVDLYNSVQKWKSMTSNMHSTISEICLIKQKELSDEENQVHSDEEQSDKTSQLQNLSEELLNKFEGLETIMGKISRVARKLKSIGALSELEQSRNASSDVDLDPVFFNAWPLSQFCESIDEIEGMYRNEFKIKSSITKEICTLTRKSALLFYEACWKYEPNIDNTRVNDLLREIISELELSSQLS